MLSAGHVAGITVGAITIVLAILGLLWWRPWGRPSAAQIERAAEWIKPAPRDVDSYCKDGGDMLLRGMFCCSGSCMRQQGQCGDFCDKDSGCCPSTFHPCGYREDSNCVVPRKE